MIVVVLNQPDAHLAGNIAYLSRAITEIPTNHLKWVENFQYAINVLIRSLQSLSEGTVWKSPLIHSERFLVIYNYNLVIWELIK